MKNILLSLSLLLACASYSAQPNIIMILADDIGAEALDLYGGDYVLTPRINSLATDGVMFKNAHATPGCAPTRARFLTGRDATKTGVVAVIGGAAQLDVSYEITIANVLQDAGYNTGVFGKWHQHSQHDPTWTLQEHVSASGFDNGSEYLDIWDAIDYSHPEDEPNYGPVLLNNYVVDFIDADNEPFFAYYTPNLAHRPFHATPLDLNETDAELQYRDMIRYLDIMVGNVIDKVESEGLENNTIIIWMGDNGVPSDMYSSFDGDSIQGGKFSHDTKGTRVGMFIRWDGVVAPGIVYEGLTDVADISVFIADATGTEMPSDRLIDGLNFKNQITQKTDKAHRSYIYMGSQIGNTSPTVFTTEYKYALGLGESPRDFSDTTLWPYGDQLIIVDNQIKTITDMRMGMELGNYTNRVYGANPWGGNANESIFVREP